MIVCMSRYLKPNWIGQSLIGVALVLALKSHRVPPIIELEQPDPEFPLPLAQPTEMPCDAHVGLSLTLGFGGFDTSLIFEVDR